MSIVQVVNAHQLIMYTTAPKAVAEPIVVGMPESGMWRLTQLNADVTSDGSVVTATTDDGVADPQLLVSLGTPTNPLRNQNLDTYVKFSCVDGGVARSFNLAFASLDTSATVQYQAIFRKA